MKSPMDMAPNKMKTPMKMAPNKMKSPAKKMDEMYNGEPGIQQEDFNQFKDSKSPADMKSPMEMKEPMKMKSPMKMGSAYKMDKSAFKLKSAPVNMNTPGSVAKLAGVSPMKNPGQAKKSIDPKSLGTDVTNDPKYKKAKDAGKKVYKSSTGQITTTQNV